MPSLKKELKNKLKGAKRIAILGIGSSLRGDDALGLFFIEELKMAFRKVKKHLPLKLFFCEAAPENYTGEIKKFKPTHIIIVDAADMAKRVGEAGIIDPKKINANISFSTHGLPIKMLIDYLSHSLGCQIISIGIQPKSIGFGASLSAEVNKSVKQISRLIRECMVN